MANIKSSRKSPVNGKSNTSRAKPGSTGKGDYYHIEVRPKTGFVTFRTQDVGARGHIQRVTGQRETGSWATVKWLIGKEDAHMSGGKLIPDTKAAKDLLNTLGTQPVHKSGDRFDAKDRPNIPERSKPTAAQKRAQRGNIKKAQSARKKK